MHRLLEHVGHRRHGLVRRGVRELLERVDVRPGDAPVARAAADGGHELRRLHVEAAVHSRHPGGALGAALVALQENLLVPGDKSLSSWHIIVLNVLDMSVVCSSFGTVR